MADVVSKLATYTNVTPNKSVRTAKIDTITIHHMACTNVTGKTCCDIFSTPNRGASSNYCIGYKGDIACSAPENYRSWCSNSSVNDNRAITIECANSTQEPNWEISKETMNALLNLVTDICKRNGIKKLLWVNDMNLVGQIDKQNMTLHKWFGGKWINGVYYPSTACPGPYLESKMGEIANTVNARLGSSEPDQNGGDEIYRVRKTWKDVTSQIGAYKDYDLACKCADENPGYYVFNSKGKKLYPTTAPTNNDVIVKITANVLNVRKGPGMNYPVVGVVYKNQVYTIVDTETMWGKLKSGFGWICLKYTKRV